MGDQNHCHAGVALQLLDQAQHLCLGGHVQRRGRFVRDQQIGPRHHRHGDHRPLAHAPRQLERIGAPDAFGVGESHLLEGLKHLLARVGPGFRPVQLEYFGDLIADPVQWRQGPHGFLKDHRNVVAAYVAHLAGGQGQQVLHCARTAKADAARPQLRRTRQDAQHGPAGQRLARAAFPHQRQRFARHHGKADALHHGWLNAEPDAQVCHIKKWCHAIPCCALFAALCLSQ